MPVLSFYLGKRNKANLLFSFHDSFFGILLWPHHLELVIMLQYNITRTLDFLNFMFPLKVQVFGILQCSSLQIQPSFVAQTSVESNKRRLCLQFIRAYRLWTKLPKSIRDVTTLMSFKGKIRQLNISELLDDGCAACSLCSY